MEKVLCRLRTTHPAIREQPINVYSLDQRHHYLLI
jgi:hypothetical protein